MFRFANPSIFTAFIFANLSISGGILMGLVIILNAKILKNFLKIN